jgi:hypothetical protein
MNELVWSTGGMVMKVENVVGRKEPDPVPVSPPQIPLELAWDLALASAVRGRKLKVDPSENV